MMFHDRLKQEQPQVYRILQNALQHHRLAHAYMFIGDETTPKKECAMLLAQSLVCQEKIDGFACEVCDACKRVMQHNYADMVYLDGSDASIKKESILALKKEFSKTNQEGIGSKIYIVDHAENATISALNSILTFLEEPQSETLAIFLVDHVELMLDTIVSRCQLIQFQKQDRKQYMLQLIPKMDAFDANFLSYKTSSVKQALELQESDEYQHACYVFKEYIKMFLNRDPKASIFLQMEGIVKGKRDNKKVLAYFLDMLDIAASDAMTNRVVDDHFYTTILAKIENPQALRLKQICNQIQDKNIKSANLNLLVDEFIYEMESVYE